MSFTYSDLIEYLLINRISSYMFTVWDLGNGLFELYPSCPDFTGSILSALQHHDDLSVQFDCDDQVIKVCHDLDILLPAN